MDATPGSRSPRRARGFTLIEIVVVLFILGIVVSMAAAITSALMSTQRLSTTTTRMQAVDTAIVQFAMQRKRLPCPADGRLASAAATAGFEQRDAATGKCNIGGVADNVQHGVVPWASLGLGESDATDGWNRRLTYRIQPSLGNDSSLDMSGCDPAKTATGAAVAACAPGCTSANIAACTAPSDFLLSKGLQVRNVAGTVIMNPAAVAPNAPTGAAYVVVSAGSSGGGAYLSSGVLGSSPSVDGNEEVKNYADKVLQAYYVDDSISDASGATHFDDIVSRPALLTVINKAGLGPRSH